MEKYTTPKLNTAFLKKKIKGYKQKGKESGLGEGVTTGDEIVKTDTQMTDDEAAGGADYAKARRNLEYNLNQFAIAKKKGLKPKASAMEKVKKSADRYKKAKDTDAAKAYRRKEKLQELEYSME